MNRRHRLRSRAAFRAVRAARAAAGTAELRVAVAGNEVGVARVGFAIPRATGGAVARNRLRRRLRAALRPGVDGLRGLDVVVSSRPGAAELPWTELCDQLASCSAGAVQRLAARRAGR